MPAYYRCKWCNGDHRLPREFPSKSVFDSIPLHQYVCTCPLQDQGAIYRRTDVFWREGRGAERPVPPKGASGEEA